MATKTIGKIGMTLENEYVPGQTYEHLDVVTYQGSSYASKKDGNTSAPIITADWQKIAQKGDKGDQGFAGWQPYIVADTTAITGKTLLKLQDWIGGQGTKPTTNVGQWQTAAGGYTSIPSQANDIKGPPSDNLLAEYVHSGNKEVVIQSYDSATGIFTAPNHGLVNGRNGNFVQNWNVYDNPTNIMFAPDPQWGYTVTVLDSNTFKLSSNPTIPPNLDFSKFHFEEFTNASTVVVSNLGGQKAIMVEGVSKSMRFQNSVTMCSEINGITQAGFSHMSINNGVKLETITPPTAHIYSFSAVIIVGKRPVVKYELMKTAPTNATTMTSVINKWTIIANTEIVGINSINLNSYLPNGATFKIFKL